MDKKIKGKRGSEYPLNLRGFALLLSLMILCSYFPVYAIDEYKETSEYYSAMAQSDDSIISALHYETMSYLYSITDAIKESRQTMNNNFANIYRNADGNHSASLVAIYDRVGDVYTRVGEHHNQITASLTSLKTQLQSYIDNSFQGFYSDLMPNFTSLKEQINQHIDESFNTLNNTVEQGSKDVQSNADKNTQNQIDNSNKNAEEQKQNDNENTSKIGGFFDNLFNNIRDFFVSLFKPSDEYFDTLRADLDTYLTEHLGFVYEVPASLLSHSLTMYFRLVDTEFNEMLVIHVPEISIKLNGEKYSIFSGIDYNLFSSLYEMGEDFIEIFNIIYTLMRAVIDIVLTVGVVKMVYKKVVNKVGVSGGDEL